MREHARHNIPITFPSHFQHIILTDAKGKKKGRVVIDIQKLNKMVLTNFYSLLV